MSKWLNGRFKNDPVPKHELFSTEEQANKALSAALELHKQKGRTVKEEWIGGDLRYQVTDQDGFVAVHWLSDQSSG